MMTALDYFRHCSTCKKPIPYEGSYFKCSVSTCNRRATALYFCSVPCWDAHVPDARHRDAWAEQEVAPKAPDPNAVQSDTAPIRRKIAASSTPRTTSSAKPNAQPPQDVLIVMSKLKGYIRAAADMKTSDGVSGPLSDHIRDVCERAIQSAHANERKTVLARDIDAALKNEDATE